LGVAVGGIGSILAAAALVSVRDHFAIVNVALILVLFVLLGAVTGGRLAGAGSALTAAAALDFFHTRPYNSLKISDAADIETTVLFLFVGLAVGEIALRAEHIRAAVTGHRIELKRVQRIARLAAAGESTDDLISAVVAELTETLRLRECRFEHPPFRTELPTLEPGGGVAGHDVSYYTKDGFELPRGGAALPLRVNGVVTGRFVLVPNLGVGVSLDHRITASSLVDQLSASLRARAA
jgi:hypothetical protein